MISHQYFPKTVRIIEVGPRDGLQNEKHLLSIDDKKYLIKKLADAGLKTIEAGSFVSSEKIPQLANTAELLAQLNLESSIAYPILIFNERGLDMALENGVKHIAIGTSASSTFTEKNIHCSNEESLQRFKPLITRAIENRLHVRGYLSCVLGCPYEGKIPYEKTLALAKALLELGCEEISLGDTIGIGTANQVHDLLSLILKDISIKQIAVHFHDTYGQALCNVYAALEHGISTIDSAIAGLGGCPYAKGAAGNLATEDLVYLLNGLNIQSGVDLHKLLEASQFISKLLNHPPRSKTALALKKD